MSENKIMFLSFGGSRVDLEGWVSVDNYLPCCPKKRDGSDLISDWYTVIDKDGALNKAYYHRFHGWMIQSYEHVGLFIYGYIPLENVIYWK